MKLAKRIAIPAKPLKMSATLLFACCSGLYAAEQVSTDNTEPLAGALAKEQQSPLEDKAPAWPMQIPKVPVKYDWVLLKSGELFAGDLLAMYQDSVDFDSDEAGTISIGLDDIEQIRTKSEIAIRTVDNQVVTGKVLITEEKVTFIDSEHQSFPRSQILTMTPAEPKDLSAWDGEIKLGLNFSSGNSSRFDYLLSANAKHLSTDGRFTVSYTGVYAEVEDTDSGEDVETANNQRFNLAYDYFFDKKTYFRLPTFEIYSDDFKNLAFQSTLGVAVGYKLYDDKVWNDRSFTMNVYAGPSVQYTRFKEVEAGEDKEDVSPVLAFGFDLDLDLTDNTDFFMVYDGKLVNETSGTVINHLELGVDVDVMDDIDLEVMAMFDYVATPMADESGEEPEKLDSLLAISLQYSF